MAGPNHRVALLLRTPLIHPFLFLTQHGLVIKATLRSGHRGLVYGVSLSPDGRHLATVSKVCPIIQGCLCACK
jgi:hypothetical protein